MPAPVLLAVARPFWKAFWQLRADRPKVPVPIALPLGGVAYEVREQRIPWTAIDRWACRHRMVDGDFDLLVFLIDRMDELYMKWVADEGLDDPESGQDSDVEEGSWLSA